MIINSDDYVVIDRYCADDSWIDAIDSQEKRQNLVQFSGQVAHIFICMAAWVPNDKAAEREAKPQKRGGF
ncbi:hypothetical protein ACP3UV_21960 [Mixta calida]|uniref:hypothetical protein n=1 Tax=Mixta calida TaxID=665913 RepID=UPI00289E8928|nr:hypothetical protein [Mixta calida]